MAKKLTAKSKYKSPTTGDYCTAAQFIAETLVMREAKKEGTVLRNRFWNHKPWKSKFSSQVTQAYKLLKQYEPQAIINALRVHSWMYSLRTKALLPEIKKQQKILDQQAKQRAAKPVTETTDVNTKPVQRKGKLSKLSKLSKLREE